MSFMGQLPSLFLPHGSDLDSGYSSLV